MSSTRPGLRVLIDPTNPGQFFACCGLLELADRMWGGAEGSFSVSGHEFTIMSEGGLRSGVPPSLLAQLASCEIASTMSDEQISRLKRLLNQKKTTLAAEDLADKERLSNLWERERIRILEPFNVTIDWWSDDRGGGSSFKTWAGKQLVRDLVRGMQAAIRRGEWSSLSPSEWLQHPTNDGSLPLYFDADIGGQSSSIDVGFSMDALDMRSRTRPLLELAAFVGLQRFRPLPSVSGQSYLYFLWTEPLVPILAAIACCGQLPQREARAFEFQLLYRTKYLKSFLPGVPKEIRR
jgi:CRISPR-associated protein Csb3